MKVAAILILAALVACALARPVIYGSRGANNAPKPWTLGHRAHPKSTVGIHFGLYQRNLDELERLFWAVSTPDSAEYRQFKSNDEINKLIAPPAEDVKLVLTWLADNGVLANQIENNGDSLYVKTSVQVAERLLHTKFHHWVNQETGKSIIRIVDNFGVDAKIAPYIQLIAGVTEYPIPRPNLKKSNVHADVPNTLVSICPQSINTIYKVPSGTVSKGNSSVCVAEWESQYFSPQQLQQFASDFSLKIPALTSDHIVGSNDPSNPGVEATLDIQYVAGVAPGVTAWFWIEDPSAWLWTYATHVYRTSPAPLIFSISYGWSEADQCEYGIGGSECQKLGVDNKQYVARVNVEFQKIGLRGISLFAASGDSGANGRTDPDCQDSILHPAFPGCSPYITAVGATQITQGSGVANLPNPPPGCSGNSCASGGTEVAVSFDQAQFASGGGFSWYSSMPSYQKTAVNDYLNSGVSLPPSSYYNAAGRGYPDVAAFGSNVLIESGGIEPVGGTSCSSPIFAGLMSLLNGEVQAKTGKPLGFMNPLLYKMAAEDNSAFTDITKGNNKCTEDGCSSSCQGFDAYKGWDPVTGLGTPVFANIQTYVRKLLKMQ